MPVFKVSSKAEIDLFEIGKYTEDEWGIQQRRDYLHEIDKRFNQLAENPNFPTSKDLRHVKKYYFSLQVREHVIIYRKYSYG